MLRDRLKRVVPVIAVIVFSFACWLMWHELHQYHWSDIRHGLTTMPPLKLALCLFLTILNYTILIGYDLLALRAIKHPLSLPKVAFASFTGFVASYNFGATLGGVPVRYRIYSSLGLSAVEIMRSTLMLAVTFWVGEIALAGLSSVTDPFVIPDKLHLPFKTVYGLGWVLLGIATTYVLLTILIRKPLHIRGMEVHLLSPGMTLAQIGVALVDLLLASGCLFVLLPPDVGMTYFQFLGVFLLAVVAVIMTHVPGGVGVFELVILTLTNASSKGDVVAALLIYRVIYYLLPLFSVAVMLGWKEYSLHRQKVDPALKQTGRLVTVVTPSVLAMAAVISGAVLLFSGTTPAMPSRLSFLSGFVALPFIEASHFIGSLVGAALLLVSRGLHRRLDSAWWAGMTLLPLGIIASLLKGFDYEEAILLSLVMVALYFSRHRFYRKGSLLHERFSAGWISTVLLVLISSCWLGLFVYKHVDYRNELWWDFAIHGDAPRYLRASVGAISLLLVLAIWRLMTPAEGPKTEETNEADLVLAAQLVAKSKRTNSNLALLGDKRFLFSKSRDAFIMYAVEDGSWISMGDPVGPQEQWSELIWQFRELCDLYDGRPVFYQVDPESLHLYLDQGLTVLKLGEEGRVALQQFNLIGGHFQNMRSGRNKIVKSGCTFEIIPPDQISAILPRLREISDAWLLEKHAAEKGFSLGFFDETNLQRSPCAVVKLEGKIIAFANIWKGADKTELSIDLMRYDPIGLNGLMDYLFIELMFWGKEAGYQWYSMGMAPLSGIEDRPLAPLWNKAIGLLYRHGDHFYSFDGLREYKDKYRPEWQPKYLASPGGIALPQILADVTRLIGRERPKDSGNESYQ